MGNSLRRISCGRYLTPSKTGWTVKPSETTFNLPPHSLNCSNGNYNHKPLGQLYSCTTNGHWRRCLRLGKLPSPDDVFRPYFRNLASLYTNDRFWYRRNNGRLELGLVGNGPRFIDLLLHYLLCQTTGKFRPLNNNNNSNAHLIGLGMKGRIDCWDP